MLTLFEFGLDSQTQEEDFQRIDWTPIPCKFHVKALHHKHSIK